MAKSNVHIAKSDLKSNRRGGFYWIDGKPYPSVTKILQCIDKPALRWWFGKEVYLAMVKDPTLAQQEALSAPYKTSDKAKSRGTTVHSIIEAYKKTGKVIDSVPEELRGYAEAFYTWADDNKLEVIESEKTIVNEEHKFAGTLDLLVKLNGGDIFILDIKTGKDIYLEAHLQLSAYFNSQTKATRMGVLLLKEDGKYKFEEVKDNFEVFVAVKKLWEFINKETCEKIGYGKKKIK